MGSGGSSYYHEIERLVDKYKKEFKNSGYSICHYDVQVRDFEAWLCTELEKEREKNKKTEENK